MGVTLSSMLSDLRWLTREILGNTPELDWLCLMPQELKKKNFFNFIVSTYLLKCLHFLGSAAEGIDDNLIFLAYTCRSASAQWLTMCRHRCTRRMQRR